MDEERVDRILQPADFQIAAGEHAVVDRGAVVERHELALRPALLFLAVAGGGSARHRHAAARQQVRRLAIERIVVAIALAARAVDDRLVIAGDETVRRAERRDADRAEVLLEEGARLAGLLRLGLPPPSGRP